MKLGDTFYVSSPLVSSVFFASSRLVSSVFLHLLDSFRVYFQSTLNFTEGVALSKNKKKFIHKTENPEIQLLTDVYSLYEGWKKIELELLIFPAFFLKNKKQKLLQSIPCCCISLKIAFFKKKFCSYKIQISIFF